MSPPVPNGSNPVTRSECQLRCGAYRTELDQLHRELEALHNKSGICDAWRAEHDGRINTLWSSQQSFNHELSTRLTAVERKVWMAAGMAAAIGAWLGNYFS